MCFSDTLTSVSVSDDNTTDEGTGTELNFLSKSYRNNTNIGNSQHHSEPKYHGDSLPQHRPTSFGDSQLQSRIPIESVSKNHVHDKDSHHNSQHQGQKIIIHSPDSSQNTVIPDIPLTLPPPPRDRHMTPSYNRSAYEFARVPSAHATLPADFQPHNSLDSSYTIEHSDQREGEQRMEQHNDPGDFTDGNNMSNTERSFVMDATGSIDDKQRNVDNDKKPPIVRKHLYTGTTPKFVPRQTLHSTKNPISDIHSESNRKLRQQTFQLGDIKGPVNKDKTEVQGGVSSSSEKSVIKTVQTIRKRLTQVC